MPALNRDAAIRREATAERHIPYTAHVGERIVKTAAGDYVQVLRLTGASFESADDEELNTWHERLNVTWRNIASPNVALWTHVIRRRERALPPAATGNGFAAAVASKYQQRLTSETLMVNELYLSMVYRPVAGVATGLAARALTRGRRQESRLELEDALEVCEKLVQTLAASFARYEPESVGLYARDGRIHSRLLEFLAVLINGEWQPMPVSRAPLNQVLATTRPLFGTEVIEYRLPTETRNIRRRVRSVCSTRSCPRRFRSC